MVDEYITVSKITDYVARLIGSDSNLKHVFIKGELSNVIYIGADIYISR